MLDVRWVAALSLTMVLHPARAVAQGVDTTARGIARDLGNEGMEAYNKGNFELAAEKFEKAFHVLQAPSLGLYSARSLVKLGRWVQTRERYVDVTRLPPQGGQV